MDAERFDHLVRSLAGRMTRRAAMRGSGAAVVAGLFANGRGGGAVRAQGQQVCTDPDRPGVGCACATGTQNPCGDTTLLCCANAANAAPGAPGTCTPSSVGCNPQGPATCDDRGRRCNSGAEGECAAPLVCCPDDPGTPGGPGKCVRSHACNAGECKGEGCACNSGVQDACEGGLVCCADDSSVAGGPGRCEEEAVCLCHQCQATTNPCPSSCSAGAFCQGCCSGYCGSDGHCGAAACTGVGCGCTAGVEGTCAPGLVCCQSQMTAPNAPGGPGMCATQDGCGGGDGSAAPEATPGG